MFFCRPNSLYWEFFYKICFEFEEMVGVCCIEDLSSLIFCILEFRSFKLYPLVLLRTSVCNFGPTLFKGCGIIIAFLFVVADFGYSPAPSISISISTAEAMIPTLSFGSSVWMLERRLAFFWLLTWFTFLISRGWFWTTCSILVLCEISSVSCDSLSSRLPTP